MKIAVVNVADTGPLESLVDMLEKADYRCYLPDQKFRDQLRNVGCSNTLDIDNLIRGYGYERPFPIPEIGLDGLQRLDLFVDTKAHRNHDKLVKHWPRLERRIAWYRINGGEPEHVVRSLRGDLGNEIDPPCPVITPNLWYREDGPWKDKAYAFWPLFIRFGEYAETQGRAGGKANPYTDPVCLTHNLKGWGYGEVIDRVIAMGVRCYGADSPAGLLDHKQIPQLLSGSRCLVHLKDSDAPGYSLYEAIAARCPVIVSKALIRRNRMQELFDPYKTCLVFGDDVQDQIDVEKCTEQISRALELLSDPAINSEISQNAYKRLKQLMWSDENDLPHFKAFLDRSFA